MASVVSKTSLKVDELLAPLVVSAAFQTNGHLVLTTHDGTMLDAGAATIPLTVASWDSTKTYKFGDVVAYLGRIWMYMDSTAAANVVPVLNTDKWQGLGAVSSSVWVENDSHFDGASLSASWTTTQTAGVATASLTTTAGEFETGPRALKVSLAANSTLNIAQLDENIIHGGETVTVTVRAKLSAAAAGVTLAARLYQNDGANRPVAGATGLSSTDAVEGAQTLTTSWATYTFTITAVNSKVRAIAELRAISTAASAVVLIDRIKVTRASTPALAPWPIGCVFFSTVPTNPAQLLGGGVWAAWGSGRVPVGVDTGQTEFATVEQTGGEKTHVLTAPEMPSHVHTINHTHATATSSSAGGHNHNPDGNWTIGLLSNTTATGASNRFTNASDGNTRVTSTDGAHTHTVAVPAFSGNSGSVGSDGAHNNLQPYITCYMWKRTA